MTRASKVLLSMIIVSGITGQLFANNIIQSEEDKNIIQQLNSGPQEDVCEGLFELDDVDDISDDIDLPQPEKLSRMQLVMIRAGMYLLLKYVACKQVVTTFWTRIKGYCSYECKA